MVFCYWGVFMKKINIVKRNAEFNSIIANGIKYQNSIFFVYLEKNNFSYNRYGIAVSKKIGNAVIRNRYKRQIKDIIDDIKIDVSGYDFIFIARPNIKQNSYQNTKESIINLIDRIGEKNEK